MAGAGYKLFNTGDVLTAAQVNTYLQEQAVMRFANATARTTALSGVLAEGMVSYLDDTNVVQVYNGSAWVNVGDGGDITAVTAGTGISGGGTSGAVTITNSMATEITAKGDLIVGTGNATFDNLAAGSNGETLVADSTTTTGLRWQADWNVGKNKILNSDFRIAQRGTSFSSVATGTYTLDRWQSNYDGTAGTYTISQQSFTVGSAPVAGYESPFFLRYAVSTAGTGGSVRALDQRMEDVRTFAGQTITVSFWAKADTSRSVGVQVYQNFGSGGSAEVYTSGTSASVTTSWARYSTTISVPSISGKTLGASSFLGLRLTIPYGATATVDFWGVQVEAGSVATPFTTATGTLAGELAACQRYYAKSYDQATAPGTVTVVGSLGGNPSSTAFDTVPAIRFPVNMRTAPTMTIYSTQTGTAARIYDASAGSDVTVSATPGTGESGTRIGATVISGRSYFYQYVASAEL